MFLNLVGCILLQLGGHSLKHVISGQNSDWQGLTHMIIPKPIRMAGEGMELASTESYTVFWGQGVGYCGMKPQKNNMRIVRGSFPSIV